MDHLLRTCVAHGVDPIDALVMATLHPALAHGLTDHGALVPGARADVLVLPDLETFLPTLVLSQGRLVARDGALLDPQLRPAPTSVTDTVRMAPLDATALDVPAPAGSGTSTSVRVIGAVDGQLLTSERIEQLPVIDGTVHARADDGIAKLAVAERHHATGRVGVGFVHGFGLRTGAFASTVAHDAHNCVAVGCDDESMRACIDHVQQLRGGIVVARDGQVVDALALPVAGIMSDAPASTVVAAMDRLHAMLREQGVHVDAPFMMLSFLALSVIPSLKLTDRGYIDVDRFELVDVVMRAHDSAARPV